MKNESMQFDDELQCYIPAIPEPFYRGGLFGGKLECAECHARFKKRKDYDSHYVLEHIAEGEDQPWENGQ